MPGTVTYCSRLLNAILARGVSAADSYRIVLCSSVLRSKARNEPSAPTETKISEESGSHDLLLSECSETLSREGLSLQVVDCLVVRNELSNSCLG